MKLNFDFMKKKKVADDMSAFLKYDDGALKWSGDVGEDESLFQTSNFTRLYSAHWLIYSAISAKAERLSQVPCLFYDDKGKLIEDVAHPIRRLFSRPNKEQTWQDFIEATIIFLESTGNALWEIVRDGKGKIQTLHNLYPNKIRIVKDMKNRISSYEYIPNNSTTIIKIDDVIHFKYTSTTSEIWGMSPLIPLIPSTLMSLYLDLFVKNFFKNAGKTAGTFMTDQQLSDPLFKRIEARIEKVYQGVNNAWKPLILDGKMKYEPSTFKMTEMPFGDLSKDLIKRILSVLDVPPIIIGSLEGASYANAQQQYQIFWESLIAKAGKITDKINYVLLPQMGYEGYNIELDFSQVKALIDEEKQAKSDFMYIRAQVKTPNEIRMERWGLQPLEGGDMFTPVPAVSGEGVGKTVTKSEQTDDKVGLAEWREFDKAAEKSEKELIKNIVDIFTDVEKDTLKKVKKNYKTKDIAAMCPVPTNMITKVVKGTTLAVSKSIESGAKLAITEVKKLVGVQKDETIRKGLNIDYDFDMLDPVVVSWLKKHQYIFADQITQTTIIELQAELKAGFDAGETMHEIVDRVSNVFEGTVRATGARALLIARTEIITASNFGKSYAYREMGIERKQWIASYGAMTPPRPSHDRAHRQIIAQDEQFVVGSETAEYPGDPSLSPAERCHCRCTMKALLGKGE